MEATDQNDKRLICSLLQKIGLQVAQVPEADTKQCDLRATDSEKENYLFELKGFHDAKAASGHLRNGAEYTESLSYDAARAVDSGIRKAVKQLESSGRERADALRFLVLLVRSRFNPDVVFEQIIGELYGKRSVLVSSRTQGRANQLECIYFSHSAFFRYRDSLDGAIVVDANSGTFLCINDHGCRLSRARRAILSRFFAERGIMYDIPEFERQGFLVAHCDVDRCKENEVLRHIAEKYKLDQPRLMAFNRHSAMATVPTPAGR